MSSRIASGFDGELEHVLYSGGQKHAMAGITAIGISFCSPWFLMNRVMLKIGSVGLMFTHYCRISQSHQDYMEKADKARQVRLSAK